MAVADADGLEAVSMARIASELGFTTMSLYRYVDSKDELLQLMWNARAQRAESLVLEGDDWRSRLRMWVQVQRDVLDKHPWITQMPLASPPMAPNSLTFVERGLESLAGTGLADADKIRVIGLLSSYSISEARMANDAARARSLAQATATDEDPAVEWTFEEVLRQLVDPERFPLHYGIAWSEPSGTPPDEHQEFLFGVDRILDGVQALIDRTGPQST
jgi:AcrR family transcriptional regulator